MMKVKTNIIKIKPYIYDFVRDTLDDVFKQKTYWVGERKIVPKYPYCTLNIIAENKDKRTSTHSGRLFCDFQREEITTLYKTATITISIYNAWVENSYDSVNMNEAMEYTYEQINLLEKAFENRQKQEKFYPVFTVQNISPIRPLHETVAGGYLYRYEFDLLIGFDEIDVNKLDVGGEVEVKMNEIETEQGGEETNVVKIWFEVDSETGQISDLI